MKLKYLFSLFLCISSPAICQTNDTPSNAGKRYDEIIDLNSFESIKVPTDEEKQENQKTEVLKDELTLFLPKLDSKLYEGWNLAGDFKIWDINGDHPPFIKFPKELFSELGLEKILEQHYQKENHLARVLIYKFKDFAGAYSAYTVLHAGSTTKLKVGKNASESDKSLSFWKGNYYVEISTELEGDSTSKEFIILISQEISNNIKIEQLPPVVAIQMPALNRVQGSEKYCLGPVCCNTFFLPNTQGFDVNSFNLQESGGIIRAEYQLSENTKDKERITLTLVRYKDKENAQTVFKKLSEGFEKKKLENKEMDIDTDLDDNSVRIKNKKNDFTMLKQRGNLLAIAYDITDKKSGEKIIGLVPWPIEINKPVSGVDGN